MAVEKNAKTYTTFPPEVASVAAARRFVGGTLRGWGVDDVDDAMLLTSELVTNAIVHAGTEVEVVCELVGGLVRIEVHDRHQARRVPVPGDQVSGRGLLFPETLATSWGVTYGQGSKNVWFTVPGIGAAEHPPPPPSHEEIVSAPQAARPTVDQLAQRTAQAAQDTLGADCVYVLLADDDAELSLRATAGVRPEGAALEIGLEGAPVGGRGVYADLGGSPYNLPALQAAGIRSLVTAPFTVDGRAIGLLIAASRDPGHFIEDDVERLQEIADRQAPSMERARLMELERARRGWLGFLAEASSMLAGTLDQQMTMALVAQLIVPRLATWCAVFTVRDTNLVSPAYAWHADETMVADLRTLLEQLPPAPPPAEPGPWEGFTPAPSGDLPETAHRVTGDVAHAFPLLARGRKIGMLVVGGPKGARFTRDALELTEDLAGRAALAIDNARLYEEQADMSRTLQRSLLPPEIPTVPGLDVAVVYEPAGEHSEVGGDFYDVFSVGTRWRFAIGDVCGTGPEAAAVTGLARQALRILGRENHSIPEVLERLNALILEEGTRARFLTLLHGELEELGEGRVRVTYATAGHPPPLFLSPSGVVKSEEDSDLMLGVFPDATFTVRTEILKPGYLLMGFTDGVTERRRGKQLLGDDGGLEHILEGCVDLNAGAVGAKVMRAVRGFSVEPSHDDMALIVLRVEE
ncbi:SpoIIE family protein phosphatase [Actinoallomurus sp. CA-150999]|uniref:SpoIIE family protein phosphatase n=1 Tax=Actinoallomurus sp. CA-150999 TaxID=3239887 RepID=UPI003D8FB028